MALINFVRLADAVDIDGVIIQEVWQAEDDQTGEIVTMYVDIGTSVTDAQNEMTDADVAESPPPDPIKAEQPKWQLDTETGEYCVFGADGKKLFALKRDVNGNAVFTMFDTAGNPVPVAAAPSWAAYTPTIGAESGTWGTNLTAAAKYRVQGGIMKVSFKLTFSGEQLTAVTSLRISIPPGFTMDTANMAGGGGFDTDRIGSGVFSDNFAGGANFTGAPLFIVTRNSTEVLIKYHENNTSAYDRGGNITEILPFSWGDLDTIQGTFEIPVI